MIPIGAVVSMAVLFREVKRHRAMVEAQERMAVGPQMAGMNEAAARQANLQRMREQTKAQLALSIGANPMMMGGGLGGSDPTTAAYISRAATGGARMPLGMV